MEHNYHQYWMLSLANRILQVDTPDLHRDPELVARDQAEVHPDVIYFMADGLRSMDPMKDQPLEKIEWDIDANLPMYTRDYLEMSVFGYRVDGKLYHPEDVELIRPGANPIQQGVHVFNTIVTEGGREHSCSCHTAWPKREEPCFNCVHVGCGYFEEQPSVPDIKYDNPAIEEMPNWQVTDEEIREYGHRADNFTRTQTVFSVHGVEAILRRRGRK